MAGNDKPSDSVNRFISVLAGIGDAIGRMGKEFKTAIGNLDKQIGKLARAITSVRDVMVNLTMATTKAFRDMGHNVDLNKYLQKVVMNMSTGLENFPKEKKKSESTDKEIRKAENIFKKTFSGRLLYEALKFYEWLYVHFPYFGFRGVRELRRHFNAGKTLMVNLLAWEKKLSEGQRGLIPALGDRMRILVGKSLSWTGKPIFKEWAGLKLEKGPSLGTSLKGLALKGGLALVALQGILGIIKILADLFGPAAKGVAALVKIIGYSFSFLVRPLFDVLTIGLMPVAVLLMVLFSSFYKWLFNLGIKRMYRGMAGFIRGMLVALNGGFAVVSAISHGIELIIRGLAWLGGHIVGGVKAIAGGISWFIKTIVPIWKRVGRAVIGFFMRVINGIWSGIKGIGGFVESIYSFINKT